MHVFSTYNKILGIISQIILTLNHILIFDSDKIVSFSTVSEKKKKHLLQFILLWWTSKKFLKIYGDVTCKYFKYL